MTYSTWELLRQGRPEHAVRWRRLRRRAGLKLCDAALLIGCSADYLHRIETAKVRLSARSRVLQLLRGFYRVEW